ncbi:protein split ends-like isoform X4 [Pieris napi]|uniref:protein split ends-like isoform X4 n=1 Tax=Pieris napi TaxID=78633 RepID=UPI001FBA4761|nr:protein split ends-like isoform X4 [Pieris napi]
MVRETRHLWVGNLPDSIREDRIREHFKRYGRVQNVKLLGRMETASTGASGGSNSGVCATVAFMDIKSASKAHNIEHVLDERTLTTEYYEPTAIPTAAGAPSAGSSPAGSGYSGSSSSVNSTSAPASTTRFHLSAEENANNTCAMAATAAAPAAWRGTNDSATTEFCRRGNTPATYGRYHQRNNAPYATPPSNTERTTPLHRWYGATGGESTPSTPGGGPERRRRASGSGSSRSESSSPEPSDTSRGSTPPPPAHHAHNNHRTPSTHPHQWASTANGRPLAICVRNLPTRSTDSSLKDGLYHEYKKHGKVVWVKVVGQNADRYAVVRFKKPSDVEKALEVSQDKLFFGCKISVAPHQSCDDDAESAKPYETDIDEYHPKATRTLFIGNLEKDVTQQQLRDKFKHFGRIIEIDIKKGSGGGAGYAFCQYASISSVVEAIRAMDGEYVGSSRVKLGFGKPVATTCVWVDGLTEHTEKQVLAAVSRCGAATSVCVDRAAGAALVHFEQAAAAGAAVRELRRLAAHLSAAEPDQPRLCVDYASRECQDAFYEQLEKHGGSSSLTSSERLGTDLSGRYVPTARHDQLRYESGTSRSRAPSFGRSSSRTPRYNHDHYDPTDYAADRRYRVHEELGSSPPTDEAPYEDRLQSVVVSPHRAHKHRHDSSPEDRKHSKERHRSVGGSSRRSRSGSRGERHISRRRHRIKRRDGSGSRGSRTSRAGTPLRDEPDAVPTEPRRPPRERPPLPMLLPLPKFALQMLRNAPTIPRVVPAPAPASPPRPPSVSSSSSGSAPHSPSLEERIRSLDEKYERWSGSRAHADAPDRSRLRHRLLELDINEVKPSEVVRSLLAKRSVFDEDSERLEGAVRPPSPCGSPRSILQPMLPRALRYPFPSHPPPSDSSVISTDTSVPSTDGDRSDPRLFRLSQSDSGPKLENDNSFEARLRMRTPSTDKPYLDNGNRRESETDNERADRRRNSILLQSDDTKSLDCDLSNENSPPLPRRLNHDFKPVCSFFQDLQDNQQKETMFSESTANSNEVHIKTEKLYDVKDTAADVKRDLEDYQDELPFWGSRRHSVKDVSHHEKLAEKLPNKLENSLNVKAEKVALENVNNGSRENTDQIKIEIKQETEIYQEISLENKINEDMARSESRTFNHLKTLNCIDLKQTQIDPYLDTQSSEKSDNNVMNDSHQNNTPKCEILNNTLIHDKTDKDPIEVNSERVKADDIEAPSSDSKTFDLLKDSENPLKSDREKIKHIKERTEKDKCELSKERPRSSKHSKVDRHDKEKKVREDSTTKQNAEKSDKLKSERDNDKGSDHHSARDRDVEKSKQTEDTKMRTDNHNHKKDKGDRRRELVEIDPFSCKSRKDERPKHDRQRKDGTDSKREKQRESEVSKSRKSSRDESSKEITRKDSTDSSASRTSHESAKIKDLETIETKEDVKLKIKQENEILTKLESKIAIEINDQIDKKIKLEVKEEKLPNDITHKNKIPATSDYIQKCKTENEKPRHLSFDSTNVENKRKERLSSCSSLPSNIGGHKRRMSSQDVLESLDEEIKKSKNDIKGSDKRDFKDSKSNDKNKTPKFNKCHFAKLFESKTKDDKKNQVKPPDDLFTPLKDSDVKELSDKVKSKSEEKHKKDEKPMVFSETRTDVQNNLDFLAIFELRSSEEDEKQRALTNEMKEKKRIQQLQQIQELQMQQVVLQNSDLRLKEEKRHKHDEKKKECAREKRMSTERKSKDIDQKRKSRKQTQSSDTSDSDEPKKHSIFDIVDDGPTYISMYDKVKARSCKNMQKQEEEKRQEKIKAKFSQLKQSRAKREEKKRSSWDEDSDSDLERQKHMKSSVDSSSDDDRNMVHSQSKRHDNLQRSSLNYERHSVDDYFSLTSNEEDLRNKLSRKNSRTRIMSDSSDEETMKRDMSPNRMGDLKRGYLSDNGSLRECKDKHNFMKESTIEEKAKKTSLLNLFGKSDSDDNRLKSNTENDSDYKTSFSKLICNDISSENESLPSKSTSSDIRKKHRKKQKKHKISFSDDDNKTENCDENHDRDKHKNDSLRRHNKKEKRKDKIRESFDTDDAKDDKSKCKRDKRPSTENLQESFTGNAKREGKMEDIFGPLSEDSDNEPRNKLEMSVVDFDSIKLNKDTSDDLKCKDRDDSKRRKDRKRKDKKLFSKEDDNSLDVDAVSKAIEARLFADSMSSDDIKTNEPPDLFKTKTKYDDSNVKLGDIPRSEKVIEKFKKECKEKKKKKKRNREDRQSRKEHHYYENERPSKQDSNIFERHIDMSPKTILNIPLPNEKIDNDKSDDAKSLSESPSLPRLTDSPPFAVKSEELSSKNTDTDSTSQLSIDDRVSIQSYDETKCVEIDDIPMPPPIENNVVQDISEVPLPEDPPTEPKPSAPNSDLETDDSIQILDHQKATDISDDAVRSIPSAEKVPEKQIEATATDIQIKKIEEKPRAIISQEETEDAVAALLGESFGGKEDAFANCFEEVVNNDNNQIEIENSSIENENIPEEDAEEMRQAVQNLNACEMEIKPDTPVSDSDFLLIDTDTEETEETSQDSSEKIPVNVVPTSQSQSSNIKLPPTAEPSNVIVSKPKTMVVQTSPKIQVSSSLLSAKISESNSFISSSPVKQESLTAITSAPTPVITSWTLTNNKIETHTVNTPISKDDGKSSRITTNILQIRPSQMSNTLITNPSRLTAPYQVINRMNINQRNQQQLSNMQPPMIKIPENHVLYQKPQGIVISPRLANDSRLQSPKGAQNEGLSSPRLANMTILSTSPQSLNSVGITSQNALQQRSPGHVTVVRMQQPPLSPLHIPHGARAMISPNRPNSVLVQTQGAPIHFNRLPVTPVLAPISKQLGPNLPQQNKNICVQNSTVLQQKGLSGEPVKTENLNESNKIILSPTHLPPNSNPSLMNNRMLPMQNTLHVGTMNPLHLPKKVLINNKPSFEKRDIQHQKTEHSGLSFNSSPIIHVASINESPTSHIQTVSKPVMCNIQEGGSNRGQGQNVIHAINQQRIITATTLNNIIQIDNNKGQPTVLSVATIRPPAVFTKSEISNAVAVTTSSLTNVVMTPLLLKTTSNANIPPNRLNTRNEHFENNPLLTVSRIGNNQDEKNYDKNGDDKNTILKSIPPPLTSPESIAKCETDFEELLKDNTNEIKVTNDPEKKLEVNVGKTVTVITQGNDRADDFIEKCEKTDKTANEHSQEPEGIIKTNSVDIVKEEKKLENVTDSNLAEKESNVLHSTITDKLPDMEKSPYMNPHNSDIKIEQPKLFNSDNPYKELSAFRVSPSNKENNENDIHTPEENEFWSTKDQIIESVIKKVDSLCNETFDVNIKAHIYNAVTDVTPQDQINQHHQVSKDIEMNCNENNSHFGDSTVKEEFAIEKTTPSKRGGRGNRGRKADKQERVQTRQISKPARGGGVSKRGRGRSTKVDKKVKSLANSTFHNMPGDVYDFHEDSGDETAASANNSESRPRLILTIKSPLSGNAGVIPTSTLSITPKDTIKIQEKPKEEKSEVFASPSTNTRKSRRLQEKDIQKGSSDDVLDEVVKGTPANKINARDTNRKRPLRQAGAKQATDKSPSDTRKSPRGTKRSRDSLSDASVDSSDENNKREEATKDAKVPKLNETVVQMPVMETETIVKNVPPQPVVISHPQPVVNPTPIMKPPKKMISEISAKLASAFEAAAGPPPVVISAPVIATTPAPTTVPVASPGLDRLIPPPLERRLVELEPPIVTHREPRPAEHIPIQEPMSVSLGEPSDMTSVETGHIRRLVDNVPANMMPVGATEATDARVQSPALPHRPPSTHRPADRATPILIRSGGEGMEGAGVAGAAAAGAVAAARGFRGAYAGPASLPRGAHHPPPPTTKQVAIVGPHHHHPGSRVTITSVPAISPQGQVNVGDGMYPHFSQHHYQMYQQHFRATQQDMRASASPFPRCGGGLEAEGSEAPTPPLELRRPPSARVPRPAHSPSPADRHILYAVRCGRSPPPAHGSGRPPSALPPLAAPGPPHASQVPREADSLQMLLRRYPVMWQGLLALKNDSAAVQMHFVGGSAGVAADALSRSADGAATSLLRIAQRMRLEPAQLDQVHRKMKMENEHCMLLALPCGRDHMDVLQQSTNLSAGFITYLQRKQAAGIVNVAPSPRHQQSMYTVHIFPSCEFANENLNRIAPDLMHRVANIAHLLIVIATAIG